MVGIVEGNLEGSFVKGYFDGNLLVGYSLGNFEGDVDGTFVGMEFDGELVDGKSSLLRSQINILFKPLGSVHVAKVE